MMIKKRNISPKFVNCPKVGEIVNIKNLYNLQVFNIYNFKNMFFSRKNNLIIILVLVLFSIFILNLKKAPLNNKLIIMRGMKRVVNNHYLLNKNLLAPNNLLTPNNLIKINNNVLPLHPTLYVKQHYNKNIITIPESDYKIIKQVL